MFWGREFSMVTFMLYLYCENKAFKVENLILSIYNTFKTLMIN